MRLVFIFQRSLEIHKKFIQIALWIPSIYIYTATTCRLMLLYVSLIFLIVSVLVFLPVAFSLSSLTHLPSLSLSFYFLFSCFYVHEKNFLWCSMLIYAHGNLFEICIFFFFFQMEKRVRKEKHTWFGLSLTDYHRNVDIATYFWR